MVGRSAVAVAASMWLCAAAPAHADVPTIATPVNDYAGVLSETDEQLITNALVQERETTGVQIAVLVVRTTGGQPIEDYSLAVAEAWAGGSGKRSDGVLLVLAIDDRRMRIEVGYDLEDRLTDGRSRQILEEMKGGLRGGDYGGAVAGAVDNIRRVTSGLEPVVTYRPERTQSSAGSSGCHGGLVILIIVFIVAVSALGLFTNGGSSGGSSSGWSSGSSYSSWSSSSSSSSSSTSWSGGGGSFGGGGASSGW